MKLKILLGAAAITTQMMSGIAIAETDVFGNDIEQTEANRRASTPPTTEAQMISKYPGVTQATINAFKTAIQTAAKAGNCLSLSGYGDLGANTKPTCFYAKPVTSSCTLNLTANSLNCTIDPTKTTYEWGTAPNFISASTTKWASDLSTAMGAEYANFASKLVPAVQQEWLANVGGVEFAGLGTFVYKVSATTGATSISFNGEKVVLP